MPEITDFHAHVYFAQETLDPARALCTAARDRFGLTMGRVHTKPVGPHPMWSCQLSFGPQLFGEVVPWLALNRAGLTVLVHPNTGDDLADHTAYALWLGPMLPLDVAMFKPD